MVSNTLLVPNTLLVVSNEMPLEPCGTLWHYSSTWRNCHACLSDQLFWSAFIEATDQTMYNKYRPDDSQRRSSGEPLIIRPPFSPKLLFSFISLLWYLLFLYSLHCLISPNSPTLLSPCISHFARLIACCCGVLAFRFTTTGLFLSSLECSHSVCCCYANCSWISLKVLRLLESKK